MNEKKRQYDHERADSAAFQSKRAAGQPFGAGKLSGHNGKIVRSANWDTEYIAHNKVPGDVKPDRRPQTACFDEQKRKQHTRQHKVEKREQGDIRVENMQKSKENGRKQYNHPFIAGGFKRAHHHAAAENFLKKAYEYVVYKPGPKQTVR